jgi:hypothetical protein
MVFARRIWGTSKDNVWFLTSSQPEFLHWQGSEIAISVVVETPETPWPNAIWGSGPDDIWASGEGARNFLHWTGAEWEVVTNEGEWNTFWWSIWGSGPNDVWSVGSHGVIGHYNGVDWSIVESPTTETLRAVWGTGPDDAWCGSESGSLLHWDGVNWSTAWQDSSKSINGIWGSSAHDVWLVGGKSTAMHFDGHDWKDVDVGDLGMGWWLNSVWGPGDGEGVWMVGGDKIVHCF